ncbi:MULTISPECIES: Spy/CpxP family protein refolding chaperone [unclassified Acidiphilium]|uniref:Spy/CpxP family protein refolding chaperone n=1 Tax=Acidiphilium TaxID=522 RepID=UPI00257B0511|nr:MULTISPECIES: Spy/CpxP family protein refolding chaperone [unclassified Acidiphilium]
MSPFVLGTVFSAGLVLAATSPVLAQTSYATPSGGVATASSNSSKITSHIDNLRHELKITAAQHTQWHALADVMRQNAAQMNKLYQQSNRNADKMNAVQILKSYREFTSTHMKALNLLIPAFTKLYDVLSPAQKKTADEMFENRVAAATSSKKSQ